MRGLMLLMGLLFTVACNQMAELGDESPDCATNEDCPPDEACLGGECVAPSHRDDPAPELEREADDLGKLGVERDMLESKVRLTREQLSEATEDLEAAKGDAERKVALVQQAKTSQAHKQAVRALERFNTQYSK